MPGTITLLDQDRGGEWDPLLGQTVGSYRIARLLGRGGMGAVYLARQPAIGAQVAIKFLHPRFSADRAVVERFFNEARAVNLIGHENIVKILDFSVTPEGRYYFVMEYLDGDPLSKLTAAKQPLPLSIAGPILLQCCRALQAAHARGIVHRDLKPDNVFLVRQMGRKHFVKLVDFGIAKLEQEAEGAGLTQAGTVIGTPEYMSPEQAAGRTGEVGRRSDVYSLGVVMYQLACGRVPFSGASTAQTLVAQMELPPPPPRQVAKEVPEELEAIVLKALAKKREDRFQSMQELHAALSAAMLKLGVSAELPLADEPAPEAAGAGGGLLPPPQPDPRFATQAAPPTQTRAGATAPASERAARLADWLLAPSRRLRTLAAAAAVVLALLFVARARSPEPPRPAPAPQPAAPAPRAASPAVLAPPPAPPEAPRLLSPSPAQLAAAAQEKGKHKKKEPAPAAPPKPPAKPVALVPAAAPAAKPAPPPPAPAKPVPPAAPDGPPPPLTAAEAAKAAAAAAQPKKKGESEADKVARATREMGEAAAAAAREEAALPSLPRSAKLYVVSDPLGASVTAAWAGKSATGETPVVFRVLRGAKVTLTFSKPGHAPAVQEVAAAATRLSVTSLKPLAAP